MRLMTNLPSFLTPPRSSKTVWRPGSDHDSPPDSPTSVGDKPTRYRNQSTGILHGIQAPSIPEHKSHSKPPLSSFVMPADRVGHPPPYQGLDGPNTQRRSSWQGRVTSCSGLEVRQQQLPNGLSANAPGELHFNPPKQSGSDLETCKSALKTWKASHIHFTSTLHSTYLPALTHHLSHLSPSLHSSLSAHCSPASLTICLKHWESETQLLPTAALTLTQTHRSLARDAWNALVILNDAPTLSSSAASSSPSSPAPSIMAHLQQSLHAAYDSYTSSLETAKENLWHTLDFNVEEHLDLSQEVRDEFWGVFDTMRLERREGEAGAGGGGGGVGWALPILVLPVVDGVERCGGGGALGMGVGGGQVRAEGIRRGSAYR